MVFCRAHQSALTVSVVTGLLCLAFVTSNIGCAKVAKVSPQMDLQGATHAQALQLMYGAQVSCADLGNCPGSIGMVVSAGGTSAVSCTGFLIDQDKVMTNKHCIRGIVGDCSSSLRVLFPMSVEFHAETAICSEILNTSVDGSGLDFAIIKLSVPINRDPVGISHQGIHQGFLLRNPRIEVLPGAGLQGELRSTSCRVIQDTVLVPSFDNDLAPLGTISDCEISPSNTGSPLLDSKGKVRAIIQGSFGKNFGPEFQTSMLEAPQVVQSAGNLACIPTPLDSPNTKISESCQIRPSLDINQNLRQALEKLDQQIQQEFAPYLQSWPEKSDLFEWVVGPVLQNDGEQIYIPKPKCYVTKQSWLKEYRNMGGYDQTAEISGITLREWKLQHGLNAYFQPRSKITDYSEVDGTIQFSPRDLKNNKSSLTITLSTFDSTRYFAETLPICAP